MATSERVLCGFLERFASECLENISVIDALSSEEMGPLSNRKQVWTTDASLSVRFGSVVCLQTGFFGTV